MHWRKLVPILTHNIASYQSEGLWRILTAYEDKSATAVCTLAFCTGKQRRSLLSGVKIPLGFGENSQQNILFNDILAPHADPVLFTGKVDGTIVEPIEGRGFGWDSIFVPDGEDQPFSCLSTARKNELSHRGSAVRQWAKVGYAVEGEDTN